MKKLTLLFIPMMVMLLGLSNEGYAQKANGTEVLLQGYHWLSADATKKDWWVNLQGKVDAIDQAGFDAIWLPPPSDATDRAGYLPRKWYDLNSNYGSEQELRDLLNTLNGRGIKSVADIVINHRAGCTDWVDFCEPAMGCWAIVGNDDVTRNGPSDQANYPCGNWDTGTEYDAARDLDHSNAEVRRITTEWMNWLKNDVGFAGWRYDFVHGFSAGYFGDYNDATSPFISIGENWQSDPNTIIGWIDGTRGTSTAFDFPTKYTLHEAVNGNYGVLGNLPGMLGQRGHQAITFLENHDTEPVRVEHAGNQFPNDPTTNTQILQGYAYILTHPGIPTVFYSHYFEYGIASEIDEMIAIRKANGLNSTSFVDIKQADGSAYAAILDGKVAMKIGGGNWSPSGSGWVLKASGPNYAIWDKGIVIPTVTATIAPAVTNHASGSVQVTLSSDPAGKTIKYTTDGSIPSTSNGMTYTGSFTVSGTVGNGTTVKAIAIDGATTSIVVTQNYTFEEQATMTVHWKATCGNPTIYFWGLEGGTAATTWPGETMTDIDGDGWVDYTIEASCANLLFSCAGSNKTIDLERCGDGWFENGQWRIEEPTDNVAPVLSFNPTGTSFVTTIDVTLFATDNVDPNPKIYYTLDGTMPSIISTSAVNSVALNFTATTTVKAITVDDKGNQSAVSTETYTLSIPGEGFTVHFKNQNNWSSPTVYFWRLTSGETVAWPGAVMTNDGNDWYSYTFANDDCANIIFSNSGSSKTGDLERCGDGWYKNGVWTDENPENGGTGFTVHFQNQANWSNPTIYFWALDSGESTAWPGAAMANDGNGWYSYTFANDDCANIIFNNNGASKTNDLNRCGDGWYTNGVWSSTARLNTTVGFDEAIMPLSIATYPNPVNNMMNINLGTIQNEVNIELLDASGRNLLSRNVSNVSATTIDLSTIKGGIYLLRVSNGTESQLKKIVKR